MKAEVGELKMLCTRHQTCIDEKDGQISSLLNNIEQLRRTSSTNSKDKQDLEQEITRLRKESSQLEGRLKQTVTIAEAEGLVAAKTRELNEAAEKRLKDAQVKLEAEKEEMMEALSQEVEEIEVTKKREIDQLGVQIGDLRKKLESSTSFKGQLQGYVVKVAKRNRQLSKEYKKLQTSTAKDLEDMKYAMKSVLSGSLMSKLKGMDDEMKVISTRYRRELAERKRLHNMIQDLKGNIRVFMRCRPPTTREIEQFGVEAQSVSFPGGSEVKVFNEKNREKVWDFDEVFNLDSTQEQVYNDVSDLIVSVLDGYNVCIFAYGQTGSGKTFTMTGPPENRGVNTRALNELFLRAQSRQSEWSDTISVSFLEVYNEEIRDLLVEPHSQEKLDIRQGENGNHVPGLSSVPVTSLQQVIELMAVADKHRSQSSTNMNEHSSRSHMMLTVNIVSEHKFSTTVSRGKLNLVDLAGSERVNKSGAAGQALKEAQNINKSLSALGDVIAARAQKQAHVPFRNSTLTYLLQDSLSQDSKTLMIVCCSPMIYNAEETFCSLNFAARVRSVELGKVTKNTATSAAPPSSTGSGKPDSGLSRAPSSRKIMGSK